MIIRQKHKNQMKQEKLEVKSLTRCCRLKCEWFSLCCFCVGPETKGGMASSSHTIRKGLSSTEDSQKVCFFRSSQAQKSNKV